MAENSTQTTIIGADAKFNGELSFEGTARILGSLEGRISSKGELQIAEDAACKATVEVARLLLDGAVEGDVTATERLELTAKAQLKGNIVAPRLTVADGATLVGHVTVGGGSARTGAEATTVEAKPASQNRPAPAAAGAGAAANGRADSRPDFRADHRGEATRR